MASLATFSASTGPNFFFGTHFTVAVYKIILCPFIYRLKHNRVGILCVTFCKKWKLFLADFNFKWNDTVMYGVYYPEGYSIWIYLGGGGMPLISDPPPPIEEKKISTHHHQNLLLKVPHYHQKKKIIKVIPIIETPRASH